MRRAFTLIEILVVVVILGIISTIVFTVFGDVTGDARISATQSDLKNMKTQVQLVAQEEGGVFPEEITVDMLQGWFRIARPHPFSLPSTPLGVETAPPGDPTARHPANKLITGAAFGWWYNPANGSLRSRIRDLGDPDANLELYNKINNTAISNLNQVN
ncbi:MAG: type II secretion system protein [Phycisphaeraceae bacterium]|nr:MAG: type II secretion system protein [Phycisphaeraceae bacterium]